MKLDHRKLQRISEFMPVSVSIRNPGGEVLAGPLAGRIIDICRDGACLLMSQIQHRTWHVFHSPRKDKALILELVVTLPEQGVNLTFTARPVWLNTFESDEFQERMLGVAFLSSDNGGQAGLPSSFAVT